MITIPSARLLGRQLNTSSLGRQFWFSARSQPQPVLAFSTATDKSIVYKKQVVDELMEAHDLPRAQAQKILSTVLDTIVEVSKLLFA